jgi:hypothetical protein
MRELEASLQQFGEFLPKAQLARPRTAPYFVRCCVVVAQEKTTVVVRESLQVPAADIGPYVANASYRSCFVADNGPHVFESDGDSRNAPVVMSSSALHHARHMRRSTPIVRLA